MLHFSWQANKGAIAPLPGYATDYDAVPAWGPALRWWAFLVFTYIWLKVVEKISKVPSALRNVNPTRAITCLVGVTIYSTIFKQQSIYTSPLFPRQNRFEKKINWGKCSLY